MGPDILNIKLYKPSERSEDKTACHDQGNKRKIRVYDVFQHGYVYEVQYFNFIYLHIHV